MCQTDCAIIIPLLIPALRLLIKRVCFFNLFCFFLFRITGPAFFLIFPDLLPFFGFNGTEFLRQVKLFQGLITEIFLQIQQADGRRAGRVLFHFFNTV